MPQADTTAPLRILVVEDDAMIGMLLGEMLEAMGHAVCAIEDTERGAVAAALRDMPDLMIVDAMLYEGSGVAAVATIRASLDIGCVFVSGDISEISGIDPDAVVLAKPYNEVGLVRAIAAARANVAGRVIG